MCFLKVKYTLSLSLSHIICWQRIWIQMHPSNRMVVLPKVVNQLALLLYLLQSIGKDGFMSFFRAWGNTQSQIKFGLGLFIVSSMLIYMCVCVCVCVCVFWRCQWFNGYHRWKWTRRHQFKFWTRLIAFHIALIPLGKVRIQLFSLQLSVNSRLDWVL